MAISERFKAHETIAELAADYQIPSPLIEEAIRYEQHLTVA
jgi:uncharacterized protein (DUF433 family)